MQEDSIDPGESFVQMARPKWPRDAEVRAEVASRCNQSEVLKLLKELEERIRTMGIATRYKRDRFAGQLDAVSQVDPPVEFMDMMSLVGGKLNEAGHCRQDLLIRFRRIREALMRNFADLEDLAVCVEVASMNDDGTYQPVPESAREDDLWRR